MMPWCVLKKLYVTPEYMCLEKGGKSKDSVNNLQAITLGRWVETRLRRVAAFCEYMHMYIFLRKDS